MDVSASGKVALGAEFSFLMRQPSWGRASLMSGAMAEKNQLRRYLPAGAAFSLIVILGAASAPAKAAAQSGQSGQQQPAAQQSGSQSGDTIPQQTGKPLPLNPDLPGLQHNHRLILKDGSYQIVREYKIVGDRVKYYSQERSDWEELPADLVDWDATRKWERDHETPDGEAISPAMKEAEDVDKEETEARDEEKARMPTVAPGLDLPDEDGVFVLDTFHGTPELVELPSSDMSMRARGNHGLGVLNPMAGQTANLELEGAHARIHLHVNDPAIYLSLAAADDNQEMLSHAITVNTSTAKAANNEHGAHSAQSGFAIVRVDERNAVRIVGAVHLKRDGTVTQDENVIPAKVTVMTGKHWLMLKPAQPLEIGEYALVEILSPEDISPTVWDFRVDPTKGDNPGSLTPILAPVDSRQ